MNRRQKRQQHHAAKMRAKRQRKHVAKFSFMCGYALSKVSQWLHSPQVVTQVVEMFSGKELVQ